MASMALIALSALEVRTTGTIPISVMPDRICSLVMAFRLSSQAASLLTEIRLSGPMAEKRSGKRSIITAQMLLTNKNVESVSITRYRFLALRERYRLQAFVPLRSDAHRISATFPEHSSRWHSPGCGAPATL